MLRVPRTWAEITPGWVTEALQREFPGVVVSGVRRHDLAHGTNARAMLALSYAEGTGPERIFIKREGAWINRLALTALRARDAEIELAASGLDLPLEHPRVLAAASDRRRLAGIVVMEDLGTRGAVPSVMTEPLEADAVATGLAGLARLHDRFWERPVPFHAWRQGGPWRPVAYAGFVHAQRRLRGLRRPDLVVDTPGAITRGFLGWASEAARAPQTLLHGDPHLANTYRIGAEVGFLDWQLVRRGSYIHDVGYFLVSALSPTDRRAHERDLVAGYAAALGGRVTPAEAWDAYRATPVFGLGSWLQTLAGGGFQPDEVSLAAIERFASAYVDLRG
jgi:hypothetical protein